MRTYISLTDLLTMVSFLPTVLGNLISIGPGTYPSNKTLGQEQSVILVLGSCEFMHDGQLVNINVYVATTDWLVVQIWRPVEDMIGKMELIHSKLVKPNQSDSIFQIWYHDEIVHVKSGDKIGLMNLNSTLPVPYIANHKMAADVWHNSHQGAPPDTGQVLTFDEFGFPYHFSITVTFKADRPNIYDILHKASNTTRNYTSVNTSQKEDYYKNFDFEDEKHNTSTNDIPIHNHVRYRYDNIPSLDLRRFNHDDYDYDVSEDLYPEKHQDVLKTEVLPPDTFTPVYSDQGNLSSEKHQKINVLNTPGVLPHDTVTPGYSDQGDLYPEKHQNDNTLRTPGVLPSDTTTPVYSDKGDLNPEKHQNNVLRTPGVLPSATVTPVYSDKGDLYPTTLNDVSTQTSSGFLTPSIETVASLNNLTSPSNDYMTSPDSLNVTSVNSVTNLPFAHVVNVSNTTDISVLTVSDIFNTTNTTFELNVTSQDNRSSISNDVPTSPTSLQSESDSNVTSTMTSPAIFNSTPHTPSRNITKNNSQSKENIKQNVSEYKKTKINSVEH